MHVKVYIASPYTIGDKLENVKRQIDMADKLMNLGFVPFVPLLSHYQHEIHPRGYDDWMELDFAWIDSCDCLLRLDGESNGADMEVDFARASGIPVFYTLEDLTLYYTSNEPTLTITEEQYSELKRFYLNDDEAIKYRYPIGVLYNPFKDGLVHVKLIEPSSDYMLNKLPWLVELEKRAELQNTPK